MHENNESVKINFEEIKQNLLNNARTLLPTWFPAGVFKGAEFQVGSLHGEAGKSLKVNTETGKWNDFATENHGSNLLDLYREKEGLKTTGEAVKALTENGTLSGQETRPSKPVEEETPEVINELLDTMSAMEEIEHYAGPELFGKKNSDRFKHEIKPMKNTPPPNISNVIKVYPYTSMFGELLFCTVRTKTAKGLPFTYRIDDDRIGNWVCKRPKIKPYPLFGLNLLHDNKDKPVLVVEGEKAALAARCFVEDNYIVTTWPFGSNSVHQAGWESLEGRDVLIWPDADESGAKAADEIIEHINPIAKSIEIISTEGLPHKSDAADTGFKTYLEFAEWVENRKTKLKTYTDEEILKEENSPENIAKRISWDKLGVRQRKNGAPIPSSSTTVFNIMKNHPKYKDRIKMDASSGKTTIDRMPMTTHGYMDILRFIDMELGIKEMTDVKTVTKGVSHYAYHNQFNPIQEMYEEAKWDGVNRLEEIPFIYLGTDDKGDEKAREVYQTIFKNLFIAMAARAFNPGCKFDHMVVLHGKQGIGKSEFVRVLGGEFASQLPSLRNLKEAINTTRGKHVLEAGEMSSFRKVDRNIFKNFISNPEDEHRNLYENDSNPIKRHYVVIGTTNEDQLLDDVTGNRRYWIVRTGEAGPFRLEQFKKDLPQIRAEAKHRYESGEKWYETPEYIEEMQEGFQKEQVYSQAIHDYLVRRKDDYKKALKSGKKVRGFVTFNELAVEALNEYTQGRIHKGILNDIGEALRSLGIETIRPRPYLNRKQVSAVHLLNENIGELDKYDDLTLEGTVKAGPGGGVILDFPHGKED